MTDFIDYTANKGLVALCVANVVLFILAKLYYVWRNKVIQRQYSELSNSEKARFYDARFSH